MRRHKVTKGGDQHSEVTETEYQSFAGQFADMLIDPDKRWLLYYVLAGGISYPIYSVDDLALDIVVTLNGSHLMDKKLLDAALAGDRQTIVSFLLDNLHETRPQMEHLMPVLEALKTTELHRSIRKAANIFKLRRGPTPKIPISKYNALLTRAEQLKPVMFKLLAELQSGTKRSIQELLEFWKKDYPDACSFLLKHHGRIQQALDDPALLKRGKKLKSRARVLAEALAGSDNDLKFSTSLVRVRQARATP